MESLLVALLGIFVFVAVIALGKWRELSRQQKLKDLVSWSALGDCNPTFGIYSYVRKPLIALLNAQCDDTIEKMYRITEEEKKYVIEIIEEYQKDIMRSYFRGSTIILKSKYVISGQDYFMAALYAFLSDHACDYQFLGNDMHGERVYFKSYSTGGSDSTYALTDFAVVFHKMRYIAYMYCRKNDILKPFVPEWDEKNIKEILDTKQIQLSWS